MLNRQINKSMKFKTILAFNTDNIYYFYQSETVEKDSKLYLILILSDLDGNIEKFTFEIISSIPQLKLISQMKHKLYEPTSVIKTFKTDDGTKTTNHLIVAARNKLFIFYNTDTFDKIIVHNLDIKDEIISLDVQVDIRQRFLIGI